MASPSNKRTWAFGLELQHAVHLPGTKTKKPLQIQHKVRQGGRLIREQEQEGTLLKEERMNKDKADKAKKKEDQLEDKNKKGHRSKKG